MGGTGPPLSSRSGLCFRRASRRLHRDWTWELALGRWSADLDSEVKALAESPQVRAAVSACSLLTSMIRPQAVQLSKYFAPTENSGMKKSENLRFCLVS